MRKTTKVAALMLATAAMLVGCGQQAGTVKVTGDYLKGATAKTTYNAFLNYNLSTLNNAITGHNEDGQHIANFVDGLVENDEYGRLSLALATKAEVNSSSSEFTFTIRPDVKWMKADGTQYSATIDGVATPQFVTAEDFVTTLKHNLDYSAADFQSDTYYLPAMFLTGGWEYWAYTFIQYRLSLPIVVNPDTGAKTGGMVDNYGWYFGDDTSVERYTADTVSQQDIANNVWAYAMVYGGFELEEIPQVNDLPSIANFSRVGAKVLEDGRLKFTLNDSMPYFTSVLTYSCFLPMNKYFVDEVGYANFGSSGEDFLYNGAFRLSKWSESEIAYVKNTEYWDAAKVHVSNVNYTILSGDISFDFTRSKYESGDIDGFTVNQQDTIGWSKYIGGTAGTGTLDDPASDDAYARFVEGVDSSFVMCLNMERDTETPAVEQSSDLTDAQIVNTNKAIKLDAVREILMKGIDLSVYNKRYGTSDVYQRMYQINTYTPANFCLDSANNKDYVDYVYEAYAAKYGISVAEAETKLEPGQFAGINAAVSEVSAARTQLSKEVSAYNTANAADPIDLPIKVEYLGLSFDSDSLNYDVAWIESANERMNGCTINADHVTGSLPLCSDSVYPTIELVNNTGAADAEVYSDMGSSGYYNMYIMGWGPDYADPLTYLNTFVTGGDMSGYTNTADEVTTYSVDANGALTTGTLLGDVDALVGEGKLINDDIAQRYSKFAEAEVDLIYGSNLIKPLYNLGQGWRVTVTKTISYNKPTATYGLSESKLKGMWVMAKTVGAAKRIECKAIYDAKKAALDKSYTILTVVA